MRRFPQRLLLAILMALCLPVITMGQQSSHVDILDEPLPKDIAKLLNERRGKGLLNADNELLARLIKNMPKDIDPKKIDPKMIEEMLRQNKELQDPKNLERLRELVQQHMGQKLDPATPKFDWRNLDQTLKQMNEFQKRRDGQPIAPRDPLSKDPPPHPLTQSSQQAPAPPPKHEKEFDEFTRWWTKNLGDSAVMHDVIKDVAKLMGDNEPNGGATSFLNEIEREWKSLSGRKEGAASSDRDLKDLVSGLKLPELSSPLSSSSSRGSTPSTDSFGSSGSATGNGGGATLTGLTLAAIIGLVAFYYWYRFVHQQSKKKKSAKFNKDAWPLDPIAIASRADVVKAFEFLSLSQCGHEAANWHHRQIAEQMGGHQPDRRASAVRLAGLYEKARYAPLHDEFSDTEIGEARARICQIAGAPTA